MSELRVLSWNVRSLRDDVEAVAEVVRSCAPDVALVQEAPRFARWRSKRASLARRCGLLVATADRTGGLLVMAAMRVEVRDTAFGLLPKTSGLHQRAVVQATVRHDGADWRVASSHFSVDAAERQAHLPALRGILDLGLADVPLVLGVDTNEDPDGPVFRELADRYQDCAAVAAASGAPSPTSPAVDPRRRIDAVFADRSLQVVSCEVVDDAAVERASDHRPLLAVLRR